jgi:hypothetical protein
MLLQSSLTSRRLELATRIALLLTLLLIFLGCGTHSNFHSSSSNQSQGKLNNSSPESSQLSSDEVNATRLVGLSIESNKLNVGLHDLIAKKNPKGDGVFVYVSETRYSGVERYVL